jgi:hypothetical protein
MVKKRSMQRSIMFVSIEYHPRDGRARMRIQKIKGHYWSAHQHPYIQKITSHSFRTKQKGSVKRCGAPHMRKNYHVKNNQTEEGICTSHSLVNKVATSSRALYLCLLHMHFARKVKEIATRTYSRAWVYLAFSTVCEIQKSHRSPAARVSNRGALSMSKGRLGAAWTVAPSSSSLVNWPFTGGIYPP